MNLFYQIYKKLFNVFSSNFISKKDVQYEYVAAVGFRLSKTFEIDIACSIPETEGYSAENIAEIAEKYSELLIMINNGLFKEQIIEMLIQKSESDSCSIKDKLFIDNILSFDQILNNEINKASKNNRPLIRPSSVFKNF